MKLLYKPSSQFKSHFSQSLSKVSDLSPSQTSLSHSNSISHSFSSLKIYFSLWYDSFSSFYHSLHNFWPRIWGFLKNFGIFQNFWGFCKTFGMGLCLNDVKSSYIVFHEHFNYIVMHFRCVLYMLSPYMLLGLDWVEPMVFLLLHITCSCIFMHTYLTFSIFVYTDCVWCFFACFYLPLSLSLVYVSCVMAPKRKSTLSLNPLCSEVDLFWPHSLSRPVLWWEG